GGPAADPGGGCGRPAACRDCLGPPPGADQPGTAARFRRPALAPAEDHRGDPLGGPAALAQGGEAGTKARSRDRESPQYVLGERKKPRLYYGRDIRPRGRALVR